MRRPSAAPEKPARTGRSTSAKTRSAVLALALLVAAPAASRASEADRLIELLELAPGKIVADVGAGDGRWTETLSRAVGAKGRVFATEVEAKLVAELETGVEARGLDNVTVLQGSQVEAGLAADCCDAILLRMVYHHFERPRAMRGSLYRSLRPNGLLAVVDIRPQKHWRRLADVPERGGHGIEPKNLVQEMEADGFELMSLTDEWNGVGDRYCALFRRIGPATSEGIQ